jgi:signal transduction histidine kinase
MIDEIITQQFKQEKHNNDSVDLLVCEMISSNCPNKENEKIKELEKKVSELETAIIEKENLYHIGFFTSGILHGLKTDIQIAYGFLEYLMQNKNLDDSTRNFIETSYHAVERINEKTKKVLEYSKKLNEKSEIDITKILDMEIDFCEIAEKHKKFERQYHGKTYQPVKINTEVLKYAIKTILENSMQATPNNEKITVSAEQKAYETIIRIKDWGCGIPDEVKSNIFRSGYTYGKSNGNGIGLSFAKHIMQKAGGNIEFNSMHKKGTTFYIIIPDLV